MAGYSSSSSFNDPISDVKSFICRIKDLESAANYNKEEIYDEIMQTINDIREGDVQSFRFLMRTNQEVMGCTTSKRVWGIPDIQYISEGFIQASQYIWQKSIDQIEFSLIKNATPEQILNFVHKAKGIYCTNKLLFIVGHAIDLLPILGIKIPKIGEENSYAYQYTIGEQNDYIGQEFTKMIIMQIIRYCFILHNSRLKSQLRTTLNEMGIDDQYSNHLFVGKVTVGRQLLRKIKAIKGSSLIQEKIQQFLYETNIQFFARITGKMIDDSYMFRYRLAEAIEHLKTALLSIKDELVSQESAGSSGNSV